MVRSVSDCQVPISRSCTSRSGQTAGSWATWSPDPARLKAGDSKPHACHPNRRPGGRISAEVSSRSKGGWPPGSVRRRPAGLTAPRGRRPASVSDTAPPGPWPRRCGKPSACCAATPPPAGPVPVWRATAAPPAAASPPGIPHGQATRGTAGPLAGRGRTAVHFRLDRRKRQFPLHSASPFGRMRGNL
jgi:hypothetical protein